jgi:MFS family permease
VADAKKQLNVVLVLGGTQTLAWASSFYLPAILADRMAAEVGMTSAWFFAAFSAALVVSALIGPRVGRTVDAIGGREVLAASNVVMAFGLVTMASAHSQPVLWLAWLIMGIGMGLGLYDTAFAALGRIYGATARPAITGITLIAGFASTVGWPLTAWGASELGWRETCVAWAIAHILVGLPLNRFMLPRLTNPVAAREADAKPHVPVDRAMVLLGLAFACSWMVVAAMAVHLPRLIEASGATTAQAVAAGALIGPAQVAARLAEAGVFTRFHPLVSARLSVLLHPLGACLLALAGPGLAAGLFAVFHGAGSGILTIARGTVPLAVFGPQNYGYRLGLLGAPSRVAMAAAPLLFGLLIDWYGVGVLVISSALSVVALAGLFLVPIPSRSSR